MVLSLNAANLRRNDGYVAFYWLLYLVHNINKGVTAATDSPFEWLWIHCKFLRLGMWSQLSYCMSSGLLYVSNMRFYVNLRIIFLSEILRHDGFSDSTSEVWRVEIQSAVKFTPSSCLASVDLSSELIDEILPLTSEWSVRHVFQFLSTGSCQTQSWDSVRTVSIAQSLLLPMI